MQRIRIARVLPALLLALSFGFVPTGATAQSVVERPVDTSPRGGLTPFRSDRELRDYLVALRGDSHYPEPPAPPPPSPPPPPSRTAAAAAGFRAGSNHGDRRADRATQPRIRHARSLRRAGEEWITNTQEAGVDEGDIVKLRGDRW